MEKIVFNIDAYSFTTTAFLIGILLVQELSNEEQNTVGNWLQLVGLTMLTYASQYSMLHQNDTNENNNINSTDDLDTLRKAIHKIEKELEKMCQEK